MTDNDTHGLRRAPAGGSRPAACHPRRPAAKVELGGKTPEGHGRPLGKVAARSPKCLWELSASWFNAAMHEHSQAIPDMNEISDIASEVRPTLATPGARLVAWFVDAVVLGLSMDILMHLYDGIRIIDSAILLNSLIALYVGGMLAGFGRTLGMRFQGIRVVSLSSGAKPSVGQAWLRAAAFALPGMIPVIGVILMPVNVLWQLWDRPYRQALHDKVARTIVVEDQE